MRYLVILPLAALTLMAGCASGPAEARVDDKPAARPIPENQPQAGGSLAQTAQFTYWKKVPGTNLHEPYITDTPLTKEEQEKLGIVPPAHEAAAK